jgi:hypothetical protein
VHPDDSCRRNPRSDDPKLRPRAEVINKHGNFGRTQFLGRMSVVESSQESSTVSLSLCDWSFLIISVVATLLQFRYGFAGSVFCVATENACDVLAKNLPAC